MIAKEIDRLKNLTKFLWPTDGDVGSPYGMRMHPILRYYRLHDGDDIGGKCGQPIYAAQSGVVVKAVAAATTAAPATTSASTTATSTARTSRPPTCT